MFKSIDKWFPGYLRSLMARPGSVPGTRHLIVCLCDHFEPFRETRDPLVAQRIVRDWTASYPQAVDRFRDADGFSPRHTFFYPQEDYDPAILDELASFCRRGYGEVEIHLHHRHDTPAGFREKLTSFRDLLHGQHGLLGVQREIIDPENTTHHNPLCNAAPSPLRGEDGRINDGRGAPPSSNFRGHGPKSRGSSLPAYAFIHGNWSLCNSRPDGDWCGVNEELGILSETGCYADFTFPSAPSPTQPRLVNALYYARDMPGRPRGADRGRIVISDPLSVIGEENQGAGTNTHNQESVTNNPANPCELLLITGPLALNWRRRKWGVLPRLENAEISGANPPTPDRVRLWVEQGIHVRGRPDWVFVKLHTHGCVPGNTRVLMGEAMCQAHGLLAREFNDGTRIQLHYVTAREMYNLVKAAEAGLPGAPGPYRDLIIARP